MLVFLEISGKWPDDLKAIKAIKTEFHIKMADQLSNQGLNTMCYPDFIQVFMVSKVIFLY